MALYDLLLQGGRTYDPETRTFAREDVAVREGKIVLRAGEIPSESAATVLDAQGCVVSPGLIDMHVHLEGETKKGATADRFITNPPDIAFSSIKFAQVTLQAGFTTVRDLGSPGDSAVLAMTEWNDGIRSGAAVGTGRSGPAW